MRMYGKVRKYWAWVMERMNRKFKELIYTTNFKDVEVISVYVAFFLNSSNYFERKKERKKEKDPGCPSI